MDSNKISKAGEAIEHFGHGLHDKYLKVISVIVSKIVPKGTSPETVEKISTVVFYSLIAVVGGAGIAGVGHALHGG